MALSELVLIGAVFFNGLLSIINGHVVALQRVHVVLAELFIYAAALSVILFNADRRMMPWFLLAFFIVCSGFVLAAFNGSFDAKYTRDVLVIPVFVLLGMTYPRATMTRPLLIIQTGVFLVAVLEAVSPDAFAELFRVLTYYVNTRDFSESNFWNSESTLFVSATRPGDRFFGFVELHRLSSVFLEPVSLGNYCVVIAIAVLAFWKDLGWWVRLYLLVSTFLLLVGCDGRLAAASIAIIIVLAPFLNLISSRWTIAYLPLVLIASAIYILAFHPEYSDTFSGRLSGSVDVLSRIDLAGWLGLEANLAGGAADSGISYFVLTQSVIGVAVIWACICLIPVGSTYRSRMYTHGTCLFIPLNLMVSYSFFSIKVAALMWFCYGFVFMKEGAAEQVAGETLADIGRQRLDVAA